MARRLKTRRGLFEQKTSRKSRGRAPARDSGTPHARVTAGRGRRRHSSGTLPAHKIKHAGNTAHFHVYYLTRLGNKGAQLAQIILKSCERDYAALRRIFGRLTPGRLPFIIHITSGASGASHATCRSTSIAVGAKSDPNPDFVRWLWIAEADEVFMANFGRGWDCGASPGEGLSRVLASELYRGAASAGFVSVNDWLSLKRRPNFIDRADKTDTNFKSVGCSVLFLNWLHFHLNYSWPRIVAAGGANLADTYKKLTRKNTAWADFTRFVDAHFPAGKKYHLRTDNPFPV
jgi:hypothetical protein